MSEAKPSVFLSYAWNDDQPFVRKLREDLEAAGFMVWQDERDLPSRGPDLPAELRAAIDRADRFVPVIGPVAADKGNTPGTNLYVEWNYARAACRAVTAILRKGEPSLIPVDFGGGSLWFDFRDDADYSSKLPDLISRLHDPAHVAVLYHVPELPRGFLPRENYLVELREHVLGQTAQAVITSQQQTAALQGMSGVGKSVLAAAFARDCSVRRRFYDGVFWLTIGVEPSESHLVDQMKGISAALGDDVGQYHSLTSAGSRLAEILKDHACLLILDDVWDIHHAEPFRNAVGNRCGLLATTRDGRIAADLSGVGVEPVRVDVLSEDDALILLAQTARLDGPDQLPKEALLIADQCGYLAFALALCGSSAGEGTFWADILDALKEQDLDYLQRQLPDYPYPDILKALKVSIDLLEKRSAVAASHYRELAVFPPDTAIPEEAIVTFWTNSNSLKPREARQMIADLGNLSLVKAEGEAPHRRITLHDLQHAYLAAEVHERLTDLHQMLLAAYYKHYSVNEWSQMPIEEPYMWRALATHLKGAGRISDLRDLLLDANFLQAKCMAVGVGTILDDCKIFHLDDDIRLLASALTMSAHVLRQDKSQLLAQLYGRLDSAALESHSIDVLIHTPEYEKLTLFPLQGSLEPAGGAQVCAFVGHDASVNGALELSDERIVSWSYDQTLKLWSARGMLIATLSGHTRNINGVLELPNGSLLSWSDDETLRLWTSSGNPLATLEGHTSRIKTALILPNGRILSLAMYHGGGEDYTLRLWSWNGKAIGVLDGHTAEVTGALLHRNGYLVSWSHDKTLRLWTVDGNLFRTLIGHTGVVDGVLALSDNRLLSWSGDSWENDNSLRLWSLDGDCLDIPTGHTGPITRVIQLPNGRFLSWARSIEARNIFDITPRLWSSDGEPLAILSGHEAPVNGALALADSRLVSWSEDKTLRLWSSDGEPLAILSGHEAPVNGAIALADSRLVSWSEDKTLRLWSLDQKLISVFYGHSAPVNGATVTQSQNVLSWSLDNTLRLWSIEVPYLMNSKRHSDAVRGILPLSDNRLVSWSDDKTVRIWTSQGDLLAILEGHTGSVKGVIILPDDNLLSWSEDKTLRLWSKIGEFIKILQGHSGQVDGALAMSDGRLISWANHGQGLFRSGELWTWSNTGELITTLEGHQDFINGVLALSDNKILSWAGLMTGPFMSDWIYPTDRSLRLWSSAGESQHVFQGHGAAIAGALELPNGRILSWADGNAKYKDFTLRLWSTEGEIIKVLDGHSARVRGAIVIEPYRILSWSDDATLCLWTLDGESVRVMKGHKESVNGATSLPNGLIVSWSHDKTLRVWTSEGNALTILEGHTGPVISALSLLSENVVSWSRDCTIRLWSLDGGLKSTYYADSPVCAAIALSGRVIVAGDQLGWMHFLELRNAS